MKRRNIINIIKSVRKTWGDMSPVTRVVKDKKKFSRNQKHKKPLDS